MNVASYFQTWHVAPYFVRGSSVLISWAADLLTDTALSLPIDSDRCIWKKCLVKYSPIRDGKFMAYG